MTNYILNGLLKTIREDKAKVIKGFQEQDQNKVYSATEVIAMLELSFALVEASILTEIEEEIKEKRQTNPPSQNTG